jgi:hypothetical protein
MVLTLDQLAKNTKWISNNSYGKSELKADAINVSFCLSKATDSHAKVVRIRVGTNIIKKLKWKRHDRIMIFHHPDDLFSIMITKSMTNNGRKLVTEGKHNNHLIVFSWTHLPLLEKKPPQDVDYLITNNNTQLITRID